MKNDILNIAESYYKAMGRKDITTMSTYLHKDVNFVGPFAELEGKNNVVEGAKGFFAMYNNIDILEKFADDNKVMLVYNLECPAPMNAIRVAVLLTFTDNLIPGIEVFFDSRPFGR